MLHGIWVQLDVRWEALSRRGRAGRPGKSGRPACHSRSRRRRRVVWPNHRGHLGTTVGRWGPCCSAVKQRIMDCSEGCSSLTPLQSPEPSPMMAAGSKLRSSREKSLLISLVKSLFFSTLNVRMLLRWKRFYFPTC